MEKLKTFLQIALLGGMGVLFYKMWQTDKYLEKAKLEIFAAQAKIEEARTSISNVKQNLTQLDVRADSTQLQLTALRQERDSLNLLFKNSVHKHRSELNWYRHKVDSLRQERQALIQQLNEMDRSLKPRG